MEEADLAAGFGGPGPEDWLNGAAALSAALVREARTLAQAAVALRDAMQPAPGETPDLRRARLANSAAGEAALKAALLLEASEALAVGGEAAAVAERLAGAARRAGAPPALLAAPLRAAALSLDTDDGAARIAAASLAQEISARLQGA
jgi:hypothetical protein